MMVHGKVDFAKLERKKKDGEPYLSVTFTPDKHFVNFQGKKDAVKFYVTFWENAETHQKVVKKGNKGNLFYKKSDINIVEKNGKMNVYFNVEGLYFQVTSFSDYNNQQQEDNQQQENSGDSIADLTSIKKEKITNNRVSSQPKDTLNINPSKGNLMPDTQKITDFLDNLDKFGM